MRTNLLTRKNCGKKNKPRTEGIRDQERWKEKEKKKKTKIFFLKQERLHQMKIWRMLGSDGSLTPPNNICYERQ